MNLLVYLKDRIGYITIYIIGNIFTIIVTQLDRLRAGQGPEKNSVVYALILAAFFLLIFMAVDYMRKKEVYNILNSIEKGSSNLEDVFKPHGGLNGEHSFIVKILIKSYGNYEDRISAYKERQKEQLYFINQWAHQMKTPVSVLNLMLENNDEGLDDSRIESMKEEVLKLSRGLDMALYNARINDFEQDFKIEKVDIINAARNVVNDHKKEFIKYSIYPSIIGDGEALIDTDAKWIRFVINQVVTNSIKYSMYKDSDKKEVSLKVQKTEESIILSITDNGVGIPNEDIKRVFQPFFTGSNGRKYPESTGMGMYLSKVICDKLGHDILIQSEEGEWARVSIVFHKGRTLHDSIVR